MYSYGVIYKLNLFYFIIMRTDEMMQDPSSSKNQRDMTCFTRNYNWKVIGKTYSMKLVCMMCVCVCSTDITNHKKTIFRLTVVLDLNPDG